jgi:hypothetical protein
VALAGACMKIALILKTHLEYFIHGIAKLNFSALLENGKT